MLDQAIGSHDVSSGCAIGAKIEHDEFSRTVIDHRQFEVARVSGIIGNEPKESPLEKIVVIVFGSEDAARQGVQGLSELDGEGRIELYELAAIRKNADGTTTRLREDEDFPPPSGTLAGAALGSLLGLLGGGVGLAVGAGIGAVIGLIRDVHNAAVDTEFLADVSAELTPGKFAVAAHVREEWVTPLNQRMEALGGRVLRGPMIADDARRGQETDVRRSELERLEKEHASADESSRPRLRQMIEELTARLDRRRERDRQWREAVREQVRTKADASRRPTRGR